MSTMCVYRCRNELQRIEKWNVTPQAEEAGFDVLLTIDKNIDSQQNINKYKLILVVLDVLKSNIKYFDELIPILKSQLNTYQKGKTYIIKK